MKVLQEDAIEGCFGESTNVQVLYSIHLLNTGRVNYRQIAFLVG